MIWEFLGLPRWQKMLKLKESRSGKGALEKTPRVWLYYIWLTEQEAQIFRFENLVKKGSLTSKDLLFSTGNSTHYSAMAYMGEESQKRVDICLWI